MYDLIKGRDIVDILIPLLEDQSWYIDINDGKVKCTPAIDWKPLWIYVNPKPKRNCTFNFNLFQMGQFVPRDCRNCFKVVIRPHTVAQLIRLYELMKTKFIEETIYCKCGVEDRNYVFGNYGGYCYCQGLPEGKAVYRIVSEIIEEDKKLGYPKPTIILKRGCTEMELNLGPTKQYVIPYWADELEDRLMEVVELPTIKSPTPDFLASHVIRKWLEFAYDRGDETCHEFTDKSIFPNKIDTYHKEA